MATPTSYTQTGSNFQNLASAPGGKLGEIKTGLAPGEMDMGMAMNPMWAKWFDKAAGATQGQDTGDGGDYASKMASVQAQSRARAAASTAASQDPYESDVQPRRSGGLGGRSSTPAAASAGLSAAVPDMSMSMPSGMPQPSATPTPTAVDQPTTPAPSQAMAGLQMAGPEAAMGGIKQRMGMGAINPQLGQRNPPNGISGLKVLTY